MASAALFFSIALLVMQYYLDGRKYDFFNPKNLFQLYFIIQLNLVLFLGVNFDIPGFVNLNTKTSFVYIGVLSSIFLLSQVSFVIGYYALKAQHLPRIVFGSGQWSGQPCVLLCLFLYVTGYVSFYVLLQINGGYANFQESREAWRAGGMSGQGWLIFPATTVLALTSIAFIFVTPQFFAGKYGLLRLMLLIFITIFPASLLGFRGFMLLPVLQIIFAYHIKIRQLRINKLVIPLTFLVSTFTVYGIYREVNPLSSGNIEFKEMINFTIERPEFLFSIFLRSKGADVVSVIYEKINDIDDLILFYPSIIESLTIFIPSLFWPGKPEPLSVQFSQKFFGIGGGVSPTIAGEAYWHAGWFGVFALLLLLGMFYRVYVNSINRYRRNDSMLFLLIASFPSLVMMAEAMQGYINGLVLIYMFSFFIVIIFSLFSKISTFVSKPKGRMY